MKILFLCTANSCRSVLSEAIFNHLATTYVRAWSAGGDPAKVVNPPGSLLLALANVAPWRKRRWFDHSVTAP